MKSAPTKFSITVVVKIHPSLVLVKAGPFPFGTFAEGGGSGDKCGQKIDWIMERVENGP